MQIHGGRAAGDTAERGPHHGERGRALPPLPAGCVGTWPRAGVGRAASWLTLALGGGHVASRWAVTSLPGVEAQLCC